MGTQNYVASSYYRQPSLLALLASAKTLVNSIHFRMNGPEHDSHGIVGLQFLWDVAFVINEGQLHLSSMPKIK